MVAVETKTQKTFICIFRLLNLLLSDDFCEDFSRIGDKVDREALDSKISPIDMFWERVSSSFKDKNKYNGLIDDEEEWFDKFDPEKVIPHSPTKLMKIWKDCNLNYTKCISCYNVSGNHNTDFKPFCDGKADVLYLHKWLQIKTNLIDFFNGGLLEEDCFDSCIFPRLAATSDDFRLRSPPSPSSRKSVKTSEEKLYDSMSNFMEIFKKECDPEIQNLKKQHLQSQVDSEKLSQLKNLSEMITKTQTALKGTKNKDSKRIFQEDLEFFISKRQKIMK